jgi:bifunctional non-homologous end joining protein LigD
LNPVSVRIPRDRVTVEIRLGSKSVQLTDLRKLFWPDTGFTKADLIQFYLDISHVLLPHLAGRAQLESLYGAAD